MEAEALQLSVGVADAAKALGLSRAFLYQEIKCGKLQVIKKGRRALIRVSELNRYLDESSKFETH